MWGLQAERLLAVGLAGLILWLCSQAGGTGELRVEGQLAQRDRRDVGGAVEAGVSSPHTLSHLQVPQSAAGQVMAQINLLRDRLQKNPRDLEALITLGNANYDIQRFDTARDLYQAALAVDPMNVQVRTDLASCYRQLGDPDHAVEELRRVLAINPAHDTALYNLGVILLNDKKNPIEAIRMWEELRRKHPQSPIAKALGEKIRKLKSARVGSLNGE